MLRVHFKYCTFKVLYYQSSSKVTLKDILGLILRNVHHAQLICQVKFHYNFISVSLELFLSKYVNRFELYLV